MGMPGLSPRSHARDPNLAAKPGQASNADQGYLMMGKAASGSRSSWAVQAWPDQATGAALPNGSARRKSATQISFHRPRHWSLQLPRSHKRSRAQHLRVYRILARHAYRCFGDCIGMPQRRCHSTATRATRRCLNSVDLVSGYCKKRPVTFADRHQIFC